MSMAKHVLIAEVSFKLHITFILITLYLGMLLAKEEKYLP